MSKRRKRKSPPPRPRRKLISWWTLIKLGIATALLWAVIALGYYAWACTFDLRAIRDMPQRSIVYDMNGRFYSRLEGENRLVVPFDKVSPNFVDALLTREDTRFYKHHGVDPIGILRAIVRNFVTGGFHFRQGASTITQQLARNSFPLGGKNLHRKLIEAALAYRIETELSKEEILEAYMNRIYFGSGFYGIEAASQAYFGKPAAKLTLAEGATLAGLIRSPNRFSPFNNPEASTRERNVVLNRMHELGVITDDQLQAALATKLDPKAQRSWTPQNNWAMDAISRELELVIDSEQLDGGGLKIYTTIDSPLQKEAEESVAKRLKQVEGAPGFKHKPMAADNDDYLQGAALAMDNKTGGIRAIVGSRDLFRSQYNRAILSQRQIGSAVKPFVYAKGFEAGLRPGDMVDDGRLKPGEIPKKYGHYDPDNSDNTYRGMQPLEQGLILSRNTMSVRVGLFAGIDAIADTITRVGLSANPPRFPSLCLGAFEASLKDLTASYTVFSNDGVKVQPYLVEKVVDASGRTLYLATHGKLLAVDPAAARKTEAVMEKVLTQGTAARAASLGLRHRAAGKTGTTNNYQDAWFVGFDDDLTCGVWVGFDTPTKIKAGGTGAELALPIWVDIMEARR